MNINEIMRRDMLEEDKRQQAAAERVTRRHAPVWGDECAVSWGGVAVWVVAALAALGAAFTGGMWYQAEKDLAADAASAQILATGCGCTSAE